MCVPMAVIRCSTARREHQASLSGKGSSQEESILVVVHEETLRVIMAHFNGLDDETMERLMFRNSELYEFEND